MNTVLAIYNIYDTPRIFINVLVAVGAGVILGAGILISPLLSLALIVMATGAIYLLPRPFAAIQVLVVVIIFTSAMPRGRLVPMLAPNELMLMASLAIAFAYVTGHGMGKSIPGTLLLGWIILFAGTSIFPIASFKIRGIGVGFFEIFKIIAPFQYLLIFWLFNTIPRSDEDRLRLIQLMIACGSGVALIGLLQAAGIGPVVSFLKSWYPSEHTEGAADLGRITSVFGAWNVLGTFLMINLFLLTALQNEVHRPLYKWNMLISAGLSLLALVASGSYASLAGLIVGFGLIKLIDPRGLKTMLPIFLLIGIGMIPLFPLISERFLFQFEGSDGLIPHTLAYRIKVWNEIYIPIIVSNPWWGVSPSFDNLWFGFAESQYFFLIFRSGLISIFAFFMWLGTFLLWLWVIIRHEMTYMRMVALTVFTAFIILMVMGLTNPVFTYSGVIDYLWILLGLIASSREDKLHVAY